MRDDLAVSATGKVVIKYTVCTIGPRLPIAKKFAQKLLFLGIHANDRVGRVEVLLLQPANIFELLITAMTNRLIGNEKLQSITTKDTKSTKAEKKHFEVCHRLKFS